MKSYNDKISFIRLKINLYSCIHFKIDQVKFFVLLSYFLSHIF